MAPEKKSRRFAAAMQMLPIHHSIHSGPKEQSHPTAPFATDKSAIQASSKFNRAIALQLSSFLLGLVALGSTTLLTGCGGITANANVKSGGSAGSLTASTSTVAFGSVAVGSSTTSNVTLTNSTSSTVTVSALTPSSSVFTADGLGTLPATIAANSTGTVTVHFAPTTTGSASAQLLITNNSLTTPSLTIQLSGTGTTTQAGAALTVNATSIAFGSVPLGNPATQSVTLSSTGSATVTVNSASVTGTGFSVSGATFPLSLSPKQTATLSLQFDPTANGAVTGKLTIASNASSNSTDVVSLSGTGVPEAVDLSWSAPTGSSVVGYNVYRAAANSSSFQKLNSSVNSPATYTDGSVQTGTTYQYYVTSVDTSGAESVPSNTATIAVP